MSLQFRSPIDPRIATGEVTVTLRRWKTPGVRVGGRYPLRGVGMLEVTALSQTTFAAIPAVDARAAGFESTAALGADLARRGALPDGDETALYRVEFRLAGPIPAPPPPPGRPAAAELDALVRRIEAMERRSERPWAVAAIRLIAEHPGAPSRLLAPQLGMEQMVFKANVRKLKKLGLTISHEVGYSLSEPGRAVLEHFEGNA